jgi:hypothetical protein
MEPTVVSLPRHLLAAENVPHAVACEHDELRALLVTAVHAQLQRSTRRHRVSVCASVCIGGVCQCVCVCVCQCVCQCVCR